MLDISFVNLTLLNTPLNFFSNISETVPILKILSRIINALFTIPNIQAWLYSAVLLGAYALVALPIGFRFGFLNVNIKYQRKTVTGVIATCIFFPAITEELFFRVFLLPHPSEQTAIANQLFWGILSLGSFIIYHPLNALTFYPAGLKIFFKPVFLLLAALLGVICTLAYFQSGSLWTPALLHWLIVVVWLLLLGGYDKLHEAVTAE